MSYPKIADYVEKQIKGLWGTDFDDNGIPVIKTNNLTYEGIIDYSDICKRNINPKQAQNNYLQKGDLLIEKSGGTKTHSVGYVSYFDEENDKYLCNNFILALRPKHKEINSKYLFYQIQFKYESNQFSDCFNKTTGIQNLKVSDYLNKEIKVPDIKKQNDIVLQLDKSRDVITKNKALLEKYDILIKSRFIEMFGDPVTNPMEWEIVPFANVIEYMGDIGSNGANQTIVDHLNMSNEENYALMVRFLNFTNNDFANDVKYISEDSYNFFKKSKLFGGELIFCKIGSAGQNYIMPNLNRPVSLGLNQIMTRINNKILMPYLYNYLNIDYGKYLIQRRIQGAVTKSITKTALKAMPIILPPLELQQQFADFVQQIDKSKFEIWRYINFNVIIKDIGLDLYDKL